MNNVVGQFQMSVEFSIASFLMKVNFVFHLEIKVPESGGRVERHIIHVA